MLRKLAIILLCLPLLGGTVVRNQVSQQAAAPGGGDPPEWTDDFTDALPIDEWTDLETTTWAVNVSDELISEQGILIYSDTQLSGTNHWACAGLTETGYRDGIVLRSTNIATERYYHIRIQDSAGDFFTRWDSCTSSASRTTIGAEQNVLVELDGAWACGSVTGTGAATVMTMYTCSSEPSVDPANDGACTQQYQWSDDPGANAADSGRYAGWSGQNSATDGLVNKMIAGVL